MALCPAFCMMVEQWVACNVSGDEDSLVEVDKALISPSIPRVESYQDVKVTGDA